jgi:hypothetical protein
MPLCNVEFRGTHIFFIEWMLAANDLSDYFPRRPPDRRSESSLGFIASGQGFISRILLLERMDIQAYQTSRRY